jgi:uncharacterized protein DUF6064
MPEWWTYTLEDLQSFSLETYYRLFARYNSAVWPAAIVALGLGAATATQLPRGGDRRRARLVFGILAASWLWTAVAFHATRYATIHRAGPWFAGAFGLEGLLLLGAGLLGGITLERGGPARRLALATGVKSRSSESLPTRPPSERSASSCSCPAANGGRSSSCPSSGAPSPARPSSRWEPPPAGSWSRRPCWASWGQR